MLGKLCRRDRHHTDRVGRRRMELRRLVRAAGAAAPAPAVILRGSLAAMGTANSVITPAVVMRPMLLPLRSVNQRLPSAPTVIPSGKLFADGVANSVTAPANVMRPILPVPASPNRNAPSGRRQSLRDQR
jgi:hypothetical protein